MSISTEISRLQTAKTSLKTSINAKLSSGLIDDETIEDYSAFVDNIDLGTDVSDTTAVASDVLASEDFYLANGTKTTGTIPTYAGSVNVTENTTLETEGKYLASNIVVDVSGGGVEGYVRPTGSFNGDILAENAVSIESGGIVYDPLYVLVAMDTFVSKTFTKTSSMYTGGDAYVFSDEPSTLYVGSSVEHTFNTTFDNATSESWKSRYIIVYGTHSNKINTNGITVNLAYNTQMYEIVACNGTIFSSTSGICAGSSYYYPAVKYVNLENARFYNNTISIKYFVGYCLALREIKLPNTLTTITANHFLDTCRSLKSLDLSMITSASGPNAEYMCYNCPSLSTVNLTALKSIQGNYKFRGCASLATVNLPNITSLITPNPSDFEYTRFIGLPTDFDIDAVNFTGTSGYSKSQSWFHHLATQLKDNSGGTTKTMVLGATNIALIPSEDAATISAKNWTLS